MIAGAARGDRVELVSTTDEYTNLARGDRGTVTMVDSMGTVHVQWDRGNMLGLVPGEDRWIELPPEEGGEHAEPVRP